MAIRLILRRAGAALGLLAALLAVLVVAGGLWIRHRLRADLPRTSGRVAVAGLAAPVAVERDALGVPNIRGANPRAPGNPSAIGEPGWPRSERGQILGSVEHSRAEAPDRRPHVA